jgi:hypothetical protein
VATTQSGPRHRRLKLASSASIAKRAATPTSIASDAPGAGQTGIRITFVGLDERRRDERQAGELRIEHRLSPGPRQQSSPDPARAAMLRAGSIAEGALVNSGHAVERSLVQRSLAGRPGLEGALVRTVGRGRSRRSTSRWTSPGTTADTTRDPRGPTAGGHTSEAPLRSAI